MNGIWDANSCASLPMYSTTLNILPHLNHVGACSFHTTPIPTGSSAAWPNQWKHLQIAGDLPRLRCTHGGDTHGSSDLPSSFIEHEDSREKDENCQGKSPSSVKLLKKLRRYGLSGVLSYGLLNTVYYLSAFLVAWFYIAPAPGKMGYWTAVKRFLKLMAMVWAGSQVTKLVRAGGALALAPVVDKGLSWFMAKFNFKSQAKAFTVIVGCCFGLAAAVFLVITFLWA